MVTALATAGTAHRNAALLGWAALGSLGVGLFTLLSTLAVLAWVRPSAGWVILDLVLAASPVLAGLLARTAAKAADQRRDVALKDARGQGLVALLEAASDELSASELARRSGFTPQQTDEALARLSVQDRIVSRVTDDGDLVYSSPQATRFRVAEALDANGSADGLTVETEAIEQSISTTESRKKP